MATPASMVARVRVAVLTALKPLTGQCPRRRFAHGVRSSLYEHVRAGYSDKPELDVRAVCEETDKVIANVESRKGDLQGDDVRKIVSVLVQQVHVYKGNQQTRRSERATGANKK